MKKNWYTDSRKLMVVKDVLEITSDETLSQIEHIIRLSATTNTPKHSTSSKKKNNLVLNGIKQLLEEVKLYKQGKIKLKTAQQLLDEL